MNTIIWCDFSWFSSNVLWFFPAVIIHHRQYLIGCRIHWRPSQWNRFWRMAAWTRQCGRRLLPSVCKDWIQCRILINARDNGTPDSDSNTNMHPYSPHCKASYPGAVHDAFDRAVRGDIDLTLPWPSFLSQFSSKPSPSQFKGCAAAVTAQHGISSKRRRRRVS